MVSDGSAQGAPQDVGSFVMPKGTTRRMTGMAAGGLVGAAIAGRGGQGAPDFGAVGFVYVTAGAVALYRAKRGAFKPKVTNEVVASFPRSEVASSELDRGMLKAALTIAFTNGDSWEFEVPKANRNTATQVVNALGGTIS